MAQVVLEFLVLLLNLPVLEVLEDQEHLVHQADPKNNHKITIEISHKGDLCFSLVVKIRYIIGSYYFSGDSRKTLLSWTSRRS